MNFKERDGLIRSLGDAGINTLNYIQNNFENFEGIKFYAEDCGFNPTKRVYSIKFNSQDSKLVYLPESDYDKLVKLTNKAEMKKYLPLEKNELGQNYDNYEKRLKTLLTVLVKYWDYKSYNEFIEQNTEEQVKSLENELIKEYDRYVEKLKYDYGLSEKETREQFLIFSKNYYKNGERKLKYLAVPDWSLIETIKNKRAKMRSILADNRDEMDREDYLK